MGILVMVTISGEIHQFLIKIIYNTNMVWRVFDGENIICSRCSVSQISTNFRHNRSICLKCRHEENNMYVNRSIEDFINRSVVVRRSDAKKRNIPFEITTDYMIKQYNNQQGKCFYTDVEMTWGYGKGRLSTALSLDKIIPELGYVPGNCVYCIDIVNMFKKNLSLDELEKLDPAEWVKRAKKHIL